jgi:ABC-2 type transport system permease protein
MIRFLRQRSRVIGALGTPVVFWVLMGWGLGRSMKLPGAQASMDYLEYSFPGAIASILMFTAIFSTISIIEDRREGFMQGVLVAPVPRLAIALGKVFGATTLAVGQALLFLLLGSLAGISLSPASILASLGTMILLAFAMTSLGLWIAWRMDSAQGFHAIMNLFLMPMLVLSGAFFPPGGSARWLQWVIAANPLTYGVNLLRASLAVATPAEGAFESVPLSLTINAIVTGVMFLVLLRTVTLDTDAAQP